MSIETQSFLATNYSAPVSGPLNPSQTFNDGAVLLDGPINQLYCARWVSGGA